MTGSIGSAETRTPRHIGAEFLFGLAIAMDYCGKRLKR